MDLITKSHLEKFKKDYAFENESNASSFELFCLYSIVSKYVKSEFITTELLTDLNVGNGGDWGIDSIVVIVNGKIVTTKEEVKDLLDANGYIKMNVILIQAKTSESIDVGELSKTLNGLEFFLHDVLDDKTYFPTSNEDIDNYRGLIKYIYSHSAYFESNKNPIWDVFYVTCSDSNGNQDHIAALECVKRFVQGTELVSTFQCQILNKKNIVSLYKAANNRIEVDIKVEHRIALPETDKVDEGYLCLLPFSEYRKMIIDNEGQIINSVFYDNIRAFQGKNPVNKAIAISLRSHDINLFTAMNNGITVIAKKIQSTGSNLHLTDYQIVNGCQTSNVLQQNLDIDGLDKLMLTVKIIGSRDKEIRDRIIIGNNSQTEVKQEQLVALLDTQRNIEDYYNSQTSFERLYYERRSKQYKNEESKVPPSKVITIPFQILAFVAMVMGEPDQVSGYYGRIVEQFENAGKKVFAAETNPALYYMSALASYKMQDCFSRGIIDKNYKKIKFHVLFALRLMCEKFPLISFSAKNVQDYCDHMCRILCNKESCEDAFKAAQRMVQLVLKRIPNDSDRTSNKLTRDLITFSKTLTKRSSIMNDK